MQYITVHCSATKKGQHVTVGEIRMEHLQRGFSDIGYHYVISEQGEIQPGRPITKQGAHVSGHNPGNIGICLIGGLDKTGKPADTYTEVQYELLRYLITDLASKFGIKEENILGHRDWYGDTNQDGIIDSRDWFKECPCFSVKDKLQEWKA